MKSSSRSEAPFLLALLLIFALASAALVLDLTEAVETGGRARIGTILYRQRRAERKFTDKVIWDSLSQNSPVYNRDTIRTAERSAATVYLEDGTKIDMDEETMILIDIGGKKSRIDLTGGAVAISRTRVKAASGKVPAGRKAAPAGERAAAPGATPGVVELGGPAVQAAPIAAEELTIVTKQGSLIVEEGSLSLSDEGERIAVAVSSGSAKLRTEAGDSVLQTAQAAAVGKSGDIAAAIPLKPVAPIQGSEVFAVSKAAAVDFEWIGPEGFSGSLVLASDPDFEKIIQTSQVAGFKARIELAAGSYWWRVEGPEQRTRGRLLSVSSFAAPELLDSIPRKIGYRGAKPPLVDLTWLPAYPRTGYLVEVSASRDFSAPALSIRTSSAAISVNLPSDGEWFWRAKALYPGLGVETSTATASLIVERRQAEAPVIRGKASEPIKASGLSLLEGGVVISWDHVEGAEAYIVKVAVDEAIKQIVFEKRSLTSSISLDNALSPGLYYVSVSAEEADRVSPPSAPRSLVVANPEPISLVSPPGGAVLMTGTSSIDASWRDPNGLGRYVVELSEEEGFASILSKTDAVGTRSSLGIPKGSSGRLHWRVSRVNEKGERLLVSPSSSLWMPRLMGSPIQVGPRDGEMVDVFYTATINFEWIPAGEASHYMVRLFRMLSGNSVLVGEWRAKGESLRLKDLSILSVGNFAWDLRAFDEREGLVHGSSEPSRAYFKITQSKEVEAPVIELPKIIFVK